MLCKRGICILPCCVHFGPSVHDAPMWGGGGAIAIIVTGPGLLLEIWVRPWTWTRAWQFFWIRRIYLKQAPAKHFFLSLFVGILSVDLRRHYTLFCLHPLEEKKCFSGALVWVNFDNSKEYLLHFGWGTNISMVDIGYLTNAHLIQCIFLCRI